MVLLNLHDFNKKSNDYLMNSHDSFRGELIIRAASEFCLLIVGLTGIFE